MDSERSLILVSKTDQDRKAYCLEPMTLTLWMKSLFDVPVMLDCVHVTFRSRYPVRPEAVTSTHRCAGKILNANPKALTPVRVSIEPDLLFQLASNPFQVTADAWIQEIDGPTFMPRLAVQGPDWIMVHEAELFERKQVFVSFKDDEDLALAEVAKGMLRMAGLTPYLARDNRETGAHQWDHKILPAIRDSIATLIIWTPNTVANPEQVLRELRCSQDARVPVGLFRGDGATLPTEYPAAELEYQRFDMSEPWVPFAEALAAAARHHRQGNPFFGGASP